MKCVIIISVHVLAKHLVLQQWLVSPDVCCSPTHSCDCVIDACNVYELPLIAVLAHFKIFGGKAFILSLQGANASALEKEIGPEQFPVNEHYFGLVNVSFSS